MNAYLYVLSFSLATSALFGNPDFQNQDDSDQRSCDDQLRNEYFTRPNLDDPTRTRDGSGDEPVRSQCNTSDDSRRDVPSQPMAANDPPADSPSTPPNSLDSSAANDGAPYYSEEQNRAWSCCADSQYDLDYSICEEYNSYCDTCNDWDIWLYPNYLYVGYTGGDGISYRRGYGILGLFLAPRFLKTSSFITFLDAKGYALEHGKWAASAGGGARWILPSRNIVLGGNLYYDYRRFHHFNLHQIGVGIEVLSPSWDLRANGYIPTRTHFREHRLFEFSGSGPSYGESHFFARRHRRGSAWYGVDGEIGMWIKRKYTCDWWGLYAAAGPYYYFREHRNRRHFDDNGRRRDAFGGRIRLLARVWDMLDLSVIATYDPKWHTRVQGQMIFTIPLDWGMLRRLVSPKSDCCCRCECRPCLLEQIAEQPVQRNGIIVADRGKCCLEWNWSASPCRSSSSSRSCSSSL